ncbi:NlpC/P60 family protein [Spongiactinospora sp. TRM90649]|uniref:C40 family peptidase n=1 Tax=Spongiactinospora sp. TRM90649 TaxID=3031114 RepID=UPI0023F8CA42|nr:NlpC/P60 family protein [Spongiactinospora sp. TRM90649]MDF5757714.1 NlpC/P60 family protein [Spongiactinospora sp. TRM90649]
MMISPGFVWAQVAAVGSAIWLFAPADPTPVTGDAQNAGGPISLALSYALNRPETPDVLLAFGGVSVHWSYDTTALQTAEATPVSPVSPAKAARLARGRLAATAALSMIGVPFSWGGGAASGATRGIGHGRRTVGFDCSGLSLYAWAQAGVTIGHYTGTQFGQGRRIPRKRLMPGDLVFFGAPKGDPDHVGVHLGDGVMVHAPQTGDVVRTTDYLASSYYSHRYRGAVRPGRKPAAPPAGPPLWQGPKGRPEAQAKPPAVPGTPSAQEPVPASPTPGAGAATIRRGLDDGATDTARSDEHPDGLRDGASTGQGQPAARRRPAAR